MSRGRWVVPLQRSGSSWPTVTVAGQASVVVVLVVRPVSGWVRVRRVIGLLWQAASVPGPLRRRGGLVVLGLVFAVVDAATGSWLWAVGDVLAAVIEAALMVWLHRRRGGEASC